LLRAGPEPVGDDGPVALPSGIAAVGTALRAINPAIGDVEADWSAVVTTRNGRTFAHAEESNQARRFR
jgi:hypothetical protein